MVYKLVERDGTPVAKRSEGKNTVGGHKSAVRRHDRTGTAVAEVVSSRPIAPSDGDRELVVPLVRHGALVTDTGPVAALAQARSHHAVVRSALPPEAWALSRGEPALETLTA
jgi:nicotinate phosphoribosyltransferase